jgi:hypothetical protein
MLKKPTTNCTRLMSGELKISFVFGTLFKIHFQIQLNSGGSVQQQLRFYDRIINYVFAINSFGENCGFRTPVVATKVHSYLDWIDSVVLGETVTDTRSDLSDFRFSSYIDWVKAMFQTSSPTNGMMMERLER